MSRVAIHDSMMSSGSLFQEQWRENIVFMRDNPTYAAYCIGDYSYGCPEVLTWGEGATLKIGKYCSIAKGSKILLVAEHHVEWITTYPFHPFFPDAREYTLEPGTKGDVIIGNDVWIGTEAIILSGVHIGNGAVIGAGSVVTKHIEPYSIVVGNPARHVRFRFSIENIVKLEKIAWWDWPLTKVREAWPLLLSSNIEAFVLKYGEKSSTA